MNSDDYIHYEETVYLCDACGKPTLLEGMSLEAKHYLCEECSDTEHLETIQRKAN